jgi:hypothetical protein
MYTKAAADGIPLNTVSDYRSYNDQVGTFFSKINSIWSDTLSTSEKTSVDTDYENRSKLSAPPGYSEHSTGLAVDIASSKYPNSSGLNPATYENELANWLTTNAPTFGFALSYPQGSSKGAGYERSIRILRQLVGCKLEQLETKIVQIHRHQAMLTQILQQLWIKYPRFITNSVVRTSTVKKSLANQVPAGKRSIYEVMVQVAVMVQYGQVYL